MKIAWLHLIAVHVPVVLLPIFTLYISQSFRKKVEDSVWKNWFVVNMIISLFVIISYFTGPATANWLKNNTQLYDADKVENHAIWGRLVFAIQILIALVSVMGFSTLIQQEKLSTKIKYIVIIFLLINSLLILYTAHIGGQLRRPDLW